VRINYEEGGNICYWHGCPPAESSWRQHLVTPPPPSDEDSICNRLLELQSAAVLRQQAPVCRVPQPLGGHPPIDWSGPEGGDARLCAVIPLLSANGRDISKSRWAIVSTHVPGRSGSECRDRWEQLHGVDDD